MTTFAPRFLDQWCAADRGAPIIETDTLRVTLDRRADRSRTAAVLVLPDRALGSVTPDLVEAVAGATTLTALRQALAAAGVTLNTPDTIHGLPQHTDLSDDDLTVRVLTAADVAAFDAFTAGISEHDIDEAFVELDHWVVVGAFQDDTLVAAASAYPWRDATGALGPVADIGVLTHPAHRGQGHGRRVVRALAAQVLQRDHEPQYRCQVDNHASAGTARSAGFALLGTWEVSVNPDE